MTGRERQAAVDMTRGSPVKLILRFTLPLLIGQMMQQIYTLTDTMITGHFIGDAAIAAIGASTSLNDLMINFANGMCNGCGIIIGQLYGAQKMDKLRRATAVMLMFGVGLGALLTLGVMIGIEPLMRLLNTPESVFDEAMRYAAVVCGGVGVTILYNMCASFMRSLGNGRMPLVFLTISCVLNIALDTLFVVVLHIGVVSTALATLDSNSKVGLLGILDAWAYIWAETDDGRKLGYVPLDVLTDVGNLKVSIISSGKTDKKTILYDAPTAKAKEIMRLSNGTACFTLFGRKEGEWRRVRVGGVSGWIKYTQTGNLYALGDQMRSVVPYYPLLMQTKSDTLLYQQKDDAASRYMTLGQGMYVELLAESDSYAYVRTSEGGSGAYDCGDFGFLPIANLSLAQTKRTSSARCAAVRRRGLHPTRRRITFRFRSDHWSAM